MDLDGFRSIVLDSGVDVWTWIDMAISVACVDHENELKERRDGIVQRLYVPAFSRCQNCDHGEESGKYQQKQDVGFGSTVEGLQELDGNEEEDDEQRKILEIKNLLDDQSQSERSLVDLLQRLVDMDTTFKALKETDIGRHVTKLRKHSSSEVRRLVKILVRKWKDTVDEWVRLNTPPEEGTQYNDDKKLPSEAHHESIHNDVKAEVIYHAEAHNNPDSCHSAKGKVRHKQIESDKSCSATKAFDDQSYQETHHAKKQKTAHAMDFHNIPKVKNTIVTNNGGSLPVKYW